MTSRIRTLAWVGVFALTLAAGAVLAQQKQQKSPPASPPSGGMGMDEKTMQAMMAYGTPGPQHKMLARMVGKWKAVNKMYMGPGEPMVSEGTMECTEMLGGRYFHCHYTTTMMGQPFEGFSLEGYDNGQHKYFTIWIDSVGTGYFLLEGDASPDGKTLSYKGTMYEPEQGKGIPSRSVARWIDANTMSYEMYHSVGGKEMKAMEITYTRM